MKRINILLITLLLATYSFSQTNWTISNNGIPASYFPVHFTVTPNGDIYLLCYASSVPKLVKSVNNGSSWSEITMSGLTNIQTPYCITSSGGILLIGGAPGTPTGNYYVYSSSDNGANWTISNNGIPATYFPVDFTITSNGDIYLLCYASSVPKLVKSINNGSSWSEITMSGLTNIQTPYCITSSGNILLIGGAPGTPTGNYYVYSSSNNGANWTISNNGIPATYFPVDFTVTSNGDIYLLCYASSVPKLVKSINNGTSWTEITMSGLTNIQTPYCIVSSGNILLIGGAPATPTGNYYVYSSSIVNGIEKFELNNGIFIYPNPTFKEITIDIPQITKENTLIIYDINGHELINQEIKFSKENIDISKLANGIYFMKIIREKTVEVRKFVKE